MDMQVWDGGKSKCQLVMGWIEVNALLRKQADFHRVLFYEKVVTRFLTKESK